MTVESMRRKAYVGGIVALGLALISLFGWIFHFFHLAQLSTISSIPPFRIVFAFLLLSFVFLQYLRYPFWWLKDIGLVGLAALAGAFSFPDFLPASMADGPGSPFVAWLAPPGSIMSQVAVRTFSGVLIIWRILERWEGRWKDVIGGVLSLQFGLFMLLLMGHLYANPLPDPFGSEAPSFFTCLEVVALAFSMICLLGERSFPLRHFDGGNAAADDDLHFAERTHDRLVHDERKRIQFSPDA
jgi:hypothetical protein